MTDYEPNPDAVKQLDIALDKTMELDKMGKVAIDPNDDSYNEEKAKEMAEFDIEEWLDEKGHEDSKKINTKNELMMEKSIEELYSVPKERDTTSEGKSILEFSSTL